MLRHTTHAHLPTEGLRERQDNAATGHPDAHGPRPVGGVK
jgi:hypothetical protein